MEPITGIRKGLVAAAACTRVALRLRLRCCAAPPRHPAQNQLKHASARLGGRVLGAMPGQRQCLPRGCNGGAARTVQYNRVLEYLSRYGIR